MNSQFILTCVGIVYIDDSADIERRSTGRVERVLTLASLLLSFFSVINTIDDCQIEELVYVKMKTLSAVVLAALSLGVAGVASAVPLANGNFEAGNFSGWTVSGLTCSGVGSSFGGATGCYGYDADPGPYAGSFAAYLGTAAGGGVISQSLATTIGQNYAVDFYLAIGAYNGVTTPNAFQVDAGSSTLLSLVNAPAQGFAHYALLFTATSAATNLKFTHGDAPSFFILDNVAVNAVPEPATLVLMGLGLAGLGLAKRRRA